MRNSSEQRRHREERAQEGVALHSQLQVGAIGGVARDLETRQRVNANILVDDLLARPQRQPLPGLLAFLVRLPHQAAALGHSVQRIGVREGLGVAAQHDVHVAQVAIHAHALGGGDHEVGSRRAFLFRSVFRIGADVNDFLGIAEFVHDFVAIVEQIVQVADDRAQVFPGGDRAPAADGMEAHGHGALGQQGRRFVRFHFVRMVDAQHEERGRHPRLSFRPCARACRWRIHTRPERVRAGNRASPAVNAAEKARHLFGGNRGQALRRRMAVGAESLAQARCECRGPWGCRRPWVRRCVPER